MFGFELANSLGHFHFTVCRARVDIAILMDSSGSIEYFGKGNYERMRTFVQRIISSFAVGRRLAHISVSLFSSRPQVLFGLKRYYSKYRMMKAVGRAPYIRGGTNTGRALKFIHRVVFRLNGRRQRGSRRKVLIVITDGRSQDNFKGPARKLKAAGVAIVSIGIGKNYLQRELMTMATNPRFVFTAAFRSMQRITALVKRRACFSKSGPKISSFHPIDLRLASSVY